LVGREVPARNGMCRWPARTFAELLGTGRSLGKRPLGKRPLAKSRRLTILATTAQSACHDSTARCGDRAGFVDCEVHDGCLSSTAAANSDASQAVRAVRSARYVPHAHVPGPAPARVASLPLWQLPGAWHARSGRCAACPRAEKNPKLFSGMGLPTSGSRLGTPIALLVLSNRCCQIWQSPTPPSLLSGSNLVSRARSERSEQPSHRARQLNPFCLEA